MRIDRPRPGATYLIPKTEHDLRIGTLPGVDGGVAVVLIVETTNLGTFTIPVTKHQLGTINAVGNWLLKLDGSQIAELRARMVRESETPNEGKENE